MTDQTASASATMPRGSWLALLVIGLVFVGLGIVLIFWPDSTILVLTVVVGMWLIVFGAVRFLAAVFTPGMDGRWPIALVGALAVIAGLFVLREPFRTVQIVVVVLGLFWVLSGLVQVFAAWSDKSLPYRGFAIGGGLFAIGAGLVLLLWPAPTIQVVAIIAGVSLIVIGLVEIGAAIQVRDLERGAG
jgi:uncharacterized membrane protein HdeD (DUF308 family)